MKTEIKNSYKPLCKQESDNLWCRGKLLISIKRAMNSSRIELLWLVWDQSRSKYYLRVNWCFLFVCFCIEPTASHFNIYCLHFCLISSVSYDEWRITTVFIIYSRYNFVHLKATHKISPLEELVGGRSPPLAVPRG
jgi:hypothetical protein